MNVDIISRENIKPSSPTTPDHLNKYKLCLLDELAPPCYVPILLLYSSSDELGSDFAIDSGSISEKLKESLSKTLTLFYPFAGTLKGNLTVECSDNGAVYVESRASISVSEIANNPETGILYKLFPFDPYRTHPDGEVVITGVQVNFFSCGGIGIGICISHKLADGATMAAFLNSWVAAATGFDQTKAPPLDSAMFFPPKGIDIIKQSDMIGNDKVVTKRFEFNSKNLATLRTKIGNFPTRVEAVTALIWKSAMEANKKNSGKDSLPPSIATHLVNIRGRMNPPLPENSVGNLLRFTVVPFMEGKQDVGLDQLVDLLRKRIHKIDSNCIAELQGENGFSKAIEQLKEMREIAMGGVGFELYTFSSWTRFPLYEVDFGWGRPESVCTITVPVKNIVIFMGTRNGDGIEAWITLTETDMAEFERSQELLQFVEAKVAAAF